MITTKSICGALTMVVVTALTVGLTFQSPASGDVLHYIFTGATDLDNVIDSSPAGNDGYLLNAGMGSLSTDIPSGPTVPTGLGDRSYSVDKDGTDTGGHGIITNSTGLMSTGEIATAGGYTMETWFRTSGTLADPESLFSHAGLAGFTYDRRSGNNFTFRGGGGGFHTDTSGLHDDAWHHVAIVFDTHGNLAVPEDNAAWAGTEEVDGVISAYLDGLQVAAPVAHNHTGFADFLDRPIGVGSHPTIITGTTNFDGLVYSPRLMLGVLDQSEFLFNELGWLEVNQNTGNVTLVNGIAQPFALLGYSITSAGGALDPGEWTSIADNYDMDAPPPDRS